MICFLGAFNLHAQNLCENIDMAWLKNHAPFPEDAEILSKNEVSGLCEVIVLIKAQPLSLYCGKDFFISGPMLKNNKVVAEKRFDALFEKINSKKIEAENKEKEEADKRILFFKENTDKLEKLTAFEFGASNPSRTIFVITDPDCSHCKHILEWLVENSEEKKVRVKTIIYPLMGDKSRDMAAKAVCKDFGINEYLEMDYDLKPYICEKSEALFKQQSEFFDKANLNFIPFIIDSKCTWSVEGADIEALKENL
jgi:thiol:disulfide interchange protein DsbC